MKKLKLSLIFLTAISASSCKYNPVGDKINRIDMKLSEARVYEVTQAKPELVWEHKETLPIEAVDGMWCIGTPTLTKIVRYWNAEQVKEDK